MKHPDVLDKLGALLPGLRLMARYEGGNLKPDLLSGLVVTLVLIPSAIAYADLAHAPPIAGLYAALGGMIVFALLTSSRHVVVGPDAAIALLVGAAVWPLADGDPGKALALSTWLALLTGILLLIAARLRLGVAADFLSSPVMLGFLNGAAVVIVGSQLGKLCGIGLREDNTLLRFYEWAIRLPETHGLTVVAGVVCIAALILARRWFPRLPGTVLIFVLALVAGRLVDFPGLQMQVIGAVNTHIPDLVPPRLSLEEIGRLVTAAIGLAFLIFPEGILLGRAVAKRHRYAIDPDRELAALGVANLAAGLLHGFAVGASQTRTLLNDATGGRTQMVSLIAAGLLVTFIYFLGAWIATLPTVAIAAILTFTGFTLIDVAGVRKLRRLHPFSGWVSLLTSAGVIAIGVLPGILLGIILSLLLLLSQISRPQDALLGRIEGSSTLHDVGDDERARTVPGLVVYRFYGPLVFANARYFSERLEHFIAEEEQPVRQVIIDARAISEIDITAAEEMKLLIERLREGGIDIVIAKAHLPLRQAMENLGLGQFYAQGKHYSQLADAVAAFEAGHLDEASGR
jgi:SulP family sulfate permease